MKVNQMEVDLVSSKGCWYALYTHHQYEKIVADLLTLKGFETFLPLYSAVRRWKDRNKLLSLPLYPSYVFLKGGLDRRLQILMTPGVSRVVSFAEQPGIIPCEEIEAIRRVITNRLNVEPSPFLRYGDWVRVKSGPLEGIEGIVIRKKNLFRLVLSVELLEKSVSVEIDASVVEKAAASRAVGVSSAASQAAAVYC